MSWIIEEDGLWWPADDRDARPVILRDRDRDIQTTLEHTPGRSCIVQAGGNVGVYALALREHFAKVITAEPDPVNFLCLDRNLRTHDADFQVAAHRAAFGDGNGFCAPVEVQPHNCGAHRVQFLPAMQDGPVRVLTIDGLRLDACDCIWLDVEGAEHMALVGASDTIARFGPTIRIEDKGLHRTYGLPDGHIQQWLADRGYAEVARVGNDKIFRRQTA